MSDGRDFRDLRADLAGLASVCEAGRNAWPTIALEAESFLTFLSARLDADPHPGARAQLAARAAELFLVAGCLAGDAHAIAAFESQYFHLVDVAAAHLGATPLVEEIKQSLRRRLFVSDGEGKSAQLDNYSGRGELGAWVRIVAARAVVNELRKGNREVLVADNELLAVPAAGDDPELAHLKQLYRVEFEEAVTSALAQLTGRQRNLLRHHYLDNLNIDQIGNLYRVHRATAFRWLMSAREALAAGTRADLVRRLGLSGPELASLYRLIRSQLDMSLRNLLGSRPD